MRSQLLSPKRKLYYALFAFAPGTLLALFLNSVKHDMEREDEARRLAHVTEEMQGEVAREQKDQLLLGMIQDLRDRLQALEKEALAKQQQSASAAAAATTSATPAVEKQAPAATADWDQQKAAFLSASSLDSGAAAATGSKAQSGISARIQERERERVQADVRAFKAAKAAGDAAAQKS